jgi:hypothetical protein
MNVFEQKAAEALTEARGLDGPGRLTYWSERGRTSFVYVLGDTATGDVKIGTAVDVLRRLAQLQSGNPRPLVLRTALVGGPRLEGRLHEIFKEHSLQGEWFSSVAAEAVVAYVSGLSDVQIAWHRRTFGEVLTDHDELRSVMRLLCPI